MFYCKRLSVLTLFGLTLLCGCSGGGGAYNGPTPTPSPSVSPTPTPPPGSTGRMRVIHAAPGAPNIDVVIEGTRVLADRPYKSASGYFSVAAGTRATTVNIANTSTSIMNTNIIVPANADQTVLAVGRPGNVQPVVRADNNTPPASGNVRARLIHASSGVSNVDVYLTAPNDDISTGPATAPNIAFRGTTTDANFPAGAYRVRVTPAGARTPVLLDTGTVNMTAGKIYTLVIVGDSAAGQTPEIILLTDN